MVDRYTAVSYMWGDGKAGHEIMVNGLSFCVRENMWCFLNHERSLEKTPTMLLWMDALCINQDDLLEKSHQVTKMGRVFRDAKEVLIWLGVDWTSGDPAVELDTWQRYHKAFPSSEGRLWTQLERVTWLRTIPQAQPFLGSIASSQYWQRLWIIQELCLAKAVYIVAGDLKVHVNDIMGWYFGASQCTVRCAYPKTRSTIDIKRVLSVLNVARQHAMNENVDWTKLDDISRITDSTIHSKCSNILDKVYGIQKLCKSLSKVEVDYGTTKEKLFATSISALWRTDDKTRREWNTHIADKLMQTLQISSTGMLSFLKSANSLVMMSAITERRYRVAIRGTLYDNDQVNVPSICDWPNCRHSGSIMQPFVEHVHLDQHPPYPTSQKASIYWKFRSDHIRSFTLFAKFTTSGSLRIQNSSCSHLGLLHQEYLATTDITINADSCAVGADIDGNISLSALDMITLVGIERLMEQEQFTGAEFEACQELEAYLTLHYRNAISSHATSIR